MAIKTVEELNQKVWYRALKVIYVLSLIFIIGKSLAHTTEEFLNDGYVALGLVLYALYPIFIFVVFEIARRLFLYVILGTVKPSDDNYLIKLREHKRIIITILIVIAIALAFGIWDTIQIDNDRHQKGSSSAIMPNVDLPELPELPELPKLPKLPRN